MTEFVFVRHGQTEANVAGRWEGWSEGTLTPCGRAQAEALARRLVGEFGRRGIAAIYTSPLRRAGETAQIVAAALGLAPVGVEGLKEINFGALDGIKLEEMEAQHPELFARWKDRKDMQFRWPGGERRIDFFRRAARACDEILSRHSEDRVVVVTHGGTLRACLAHLLPEQMSDWWGYTLDNCGLTRVSVDGEDARLLVLNDGAHLELE
jgi:broad specificity phosphatase PhoE